jgi:hypothetical protein
MFSLPIAHQTNQSFRIKEREKKKKLIVFVFSNFWNRVSVIWRHWRAAKAAMVS